jgi:hypothetical protein
MTCDMPIVEHLVRLLIAAERQSAERAMVMELRPVGARGARSAAETIGRVAAQNGRICWAMARGHDLTLSDVLAADTGVPLATFERIFEAARSERVPFCEKLADSDVIDVGAVRRALAKQAAGCLATLARNDANARLELSIGRVPPLSYDDDFTFGGLELLQAAIRGSLELREEAGPVPDFFAALRPRVDAAVCFCERPGSETLTPVSTWCRGELTLAGALDLAMRALEQTRPEDSLAAEIAPLALIPHSGHSWLAAWQEPHLALFRVASRKQYDDVASALLSARLDAARS